jgi:hypothetical protein
MVGVAVAMASALCILPLFHARAQSPGSGTIQATDTSAVTWTGSQRRSGRRRKRRVQVRRRRELRTIRADRRRNKVRLDR